MGDRSELEDARHEVLADNTAQAVHKHLDKLFQEEPRFRSRWVWELLQNARDAAPRGGVRVWLVREPQRLLFRHNGVPFTRKGIAHLIYHGSTKHDLSGSDPIGQFGTGFLTTHLISKTVTVTGKADGRRFSFLLDRRGDTAEKLKQKMDGSWEKFRDSLTEDHPADQSQATTEYVYPLEKRIEEAVEVGVRDLMANAHYLLAFNKRIKSLDVALPDRNIRIEKKASHRLGEAGFLFDIKENVVGGEAVMRHVALIEQDGTSVAVELAKKNGRWSVVQPNAAPRIFVAFPLTATRDFCLPIIVNNERLQPREDRDTIFLRENRDGKHPNMTVLEGAFKLAAQLATLAAVEDWDHAGLLATLGELQAADWLDADWLRSQLAARFIEPLRQTKILPTLGERDNSPADGYVMRTPAEGLIPLPSDAATCHDVWDMVAQLPNEAQKLPLRAETPVWAVNLTSWAQFLGKPLDQFPEALTLNTLCQKVSAWGTVATLKQHLTESVDALDWLDRLHGLVSKANREDLFDHQRLIPNQCGVLKKITELRRDGGINDELKDIAESLGLAVRADLVDRRMNLTALAELQPKTEAEVLAAALDALNEKADEEPVEADFAATNVRFFIWLVSHKRLDKLDGFPVLTRATTEEDSALASLFRDPTKADELLLAPLRCWPEPARAVADLFSKRQTLADAYRDGLDDDAAWKAIETQGYLRLGPLYTTQKRWIPFIPDEPLPEWGNEKKLRHRTNDAVELSALAFFEKEETGLDAVRRSKTRAASLLLFLADYVLEADGTALDTVEGECECGHKHRYYRSAWLLPMWDRQWVPLGDNKQSSATAEAIAQLFEGRDEELRRLTTGRGRSLLAALKISLADLSLRALDKDEETRIALIGSLTDIVHAAGNDAEKVRLIADEIKESPELLDQIEEHRMRREKVRENQWVGAEVERLLKEAFEGSGLRVSRTGIGSDYEVEQDHVVDEKEVQLAVEDGSQSFLIEIKATYGDAVRMTPTQAKAAVENRGGFALCIVRLDGPITAEAVRSGCRFIMDIGDRIEPVLGEYSKYQGAKVKACARVGDVELVMTEAEIRFVVSTEACGRGLAFDDAVARLSTMLKLAAPGPQSAAGQRQ